MKITYKDLKINDIIEVTLIDTSSKRHIKSIAVIKEKNNLELRLQDIVSWDPEDFDYDWNASIDNLIIHEVIAHWKSPEEIVKKIRPELFL